MGKKYEGVREKVPGKRYEIYFRPYKGAKKIHRNIEAFSISEAYYKRQEILAEFRKDLGVSDKDMIHLTAGFAEIWERLYRDLLSENRPYKTKNHYKHTFWRMFGEFRETRFPHIQNSSQCPYCTKIFPSQSAIKNKRALPYKPEEEKAKTEKPILETAGLIIHDFEQGFVNSLGRKSDRFYKAPAQISPTLVNSDYGKALMLKYLKRSKGGPYNMGGWCGWFTFLKRGREYYDASKFTKLTFFVKGQNGGEIFVAGIADKKWDKVGDCVKSKDIGEYLTSGKVTQEWQKAEIPFAHFILNFKEVASVAFDFTTPSEGTIYIDNIAFE